METSDFAQMYSDILTERASLANHRNDLEMDLNETRNKIAHLDEVLNHLRPLADMSYRDEEVAGMGITDAVRYILKNSADKLSPQDVREQLTGKGFDLSGLTAPMASIYTILGRLHEAEEVERERDGTRVYYKWKPPEITDEDISL